jgi:hypothetical protein
MKKIVLFLFFGILLIPVTSHAVVELGVGWGVTALEEDLDSADADAGYSVQAVIGSGSVRLLVAGLWSDHDNEGEYSSYMAGPVWSLDYLPGVQSRIFVAISNHEFDSPNPALSSDGWGLTLGGGIGWTLFPNGTLGLDLRISDWEGDNDLGEDVNAGAGTLQIVFGLDF